MDKKINGAFRKKKVYFTQVSNNAIRDNELSLKAKGLYALIQSYITIEDFTLYKNHLKKQCVEGEKAFENTWKELKDKGYLIQYRLQDVKTKHFYYEYELLDEKNIDLAKEIHSKQNRKSKEEKSHTPKKEGMDKKLKAIPTKREGMDNRYNGKGDVYNNTDLNNINLNNTDLTTTKSSSNSSFDNLINEFEENICVLKKTTFNKFKEYIEKYDQAFIFAVIEYCAEININSFAGFKKVIDSYIEKRIVTKNEFILSVETYRANKNHYYQNKIIHKFNDYEQREYTKEQWKEIECSLTGINADTSTDIDGESLLQKIRNSRKNRAIDKLI